MNRGFVNVWLIVGLVVVIGGGVAYWAITQKPSASGIPATGELPTQQNTNSAQNSQQVKPTPSAQVGNKLSFKSCIPALYEDNPSMFRFWYDKITSLYPKFFYDGDGYATYVYAGSYCELSDGTKLVTFVPDPDGSTRANPTGQVIALFDANGNLLRKTSGLRQQTLGDLVPPKLDSLKDGKVQFSFTSGDAGMTSMQKYELNLSTFTFIMLENKVQ